LVVPEVSEEKTVLESEVILPGAKTQDESLVELNRVSDDKKT
jgi:hypothetical protein